MKHILRAFLFILGKQPLRLHYFHADVLAFLLGKLIKYRRDDIMTNLSRSFPDKDYSELKKICNEFYKHLAEIIVESIWFGACDAKRLKKSGIVKLLNPKLLIEYDKCPSGAMILCSHCGNWELTSGICKDGCYHEGESPVNEHTLGVSYKKMSSPAWDYVMKANRYAPIADKKVLGYLETQEIVRFIFNHREEKFYYYMITDQRPYLPGSDKIKVTFLNQECSTMSAGAGIAKKFGMPVLFLKMDRVSRGHYEMEYIPICADASKEDTQTIMDKYYQCLDTEINNQPANYLWSHRRWPHWQ